MMYGWNAGGWTVPLMILMMAIFWGGLIGLVLLAARGVARGDRGDAPDRAPRPTEILSHRFANGEITAEEYETRLKTLREIKA